MSEGHITDEPCPHGHTDYEQCFAPFRYCPVEGCGRAERRAVVAIAQCENCGEWLDQLSNGHWQHKISGETLCVPSKVAVPRTDTITSEIGYRPDDADPGKIVGGFLSHDGPSTALTGGGDEHGDIPERERPQGDRQQQDRSGPEREQSAVPEVRQDQGGVR